MLERRPAAAGDEAFLRELYATTRPEVVDWDDEERGAFLDLQLRAQRQDWVVRFPGSVHEVILLDGREIGRVWVAWLPDECRIVDLTVLPVHRSEGIGSRVAREILAEADSRQLRVRLTVARENAAALAFWSRLGFEVVDEGPLDFALEWAR
jgi:ribosomal protein S18 acetylase RimI-like enzyme